jgi:hypothetical protein
VAPLRAGGAALATRVVVATGAQALWSRDHAPTLRFLYAQI